MGDRPNLQAMKNDGRWYVVFRDAWGDCPAGCTGQQLYYFTVSGEQVTRVAASEAASDSTFVELVKRARGD